MEMRFAVVAGHVIPTRRTGGENLLTIDAAAERFGLDHDTLRKMHVTTFGETPDEPTLELEDLAAESKYDLLYTSLYSHMDRGHFDYCASLAERVGLSLWHEHAYPSVEIEEGTNVVTPRLIVGIGGLRLIAHRTREYAGCDAGIIERDEDGWPISASVTVYRFSDDRRIPFKGTVYMSERYPGEGVDKLWDKMPATNLERCAESAALRKAFSQETNGLYTPEEMAIKRARRGGRREQRPRGDWGSEPRSRLDLERRLAEMGLVNRAKREGVMAMLDEEFGNMGEAPERWASAIRAVRTNPQEYGLA